jgi:hypothetical protein
MKSGNKVKKSILKVMILSKPHINEKLNDSHGSS